MKVKIKLLVFTFIFFIFACGIFSAPPKSDLNLIIYNQNFALVSENITAPLKKGETEFHFTDIPEQLEPESVILKFAADAPVQMLDQKFINDVLNSHTLLEYYEGKEILFETVSPQTGERYTVKGKVIRAGREPIIETDGKIRFSLPGTPLFDALPENKLLKPSLVWNLKSSKNINASANLSYLTGGLSWEAHYDAVGADDEDYVSLYAKFIITNNTNRGFKDAGVKLLAGETQRAYQNYARPMRAAAPMDMMMKSESFSDGVSFTGADDYYIFSIDRLINIASRRTEQIEFFRTEKTPVKRVYVYRGQSDKNVKINLKIQNDKKSGLGLPIPAGKVKVYRKQEDIKVFTGEDRINHTPEDEEIVLTIGSAFDLVGERKMTDSKQLTQRTREESYSITLKNRKKKAVQIEVIERVNRPDWEMVKNSHSYEKTEAQEIKFIVDLPAGSEKTVDYRIRTRW